MSWFSILRAIVFLALLVPPTLHAMLLSGPEITSFSVDPANADFVRIVVEDHAHEELNFTALSTNAGRAFSIIASSSLSPFAQANITFGQRRYALAGGSLLRSDDSGLTWTNIAAQHFVHEQTNAAIKKERMEFDQRSRSRVPLRSQWWTPLFAVFTAAHSLFIVICVKPARGWVAASAAAVQAAATLLIVWLMLTACYHTFQFLNNDQWPGRFWNTSSGFNPSRKTGIIMNIAARPVPLLAYLAPFSLLLPGTLETILRRISPPSTRLRLQTGLLLLVSILMLSAHVYLAFVGYFNGNSL